MHEFAEFMLSQAVAETQQRHGSREHNARFANIAFDWNCPQHITPRYTEREWQALVRDKKGEYS